jgi:hypothetical protein
MRKSRVTNAFITILVAGFLLVGVVAAHAQRGGVKTDTRILYHDGPVMPLYSPNVYFIWYGNWAGNPAVPILEEFAASIGGSPYFLINTTYPGSNGMAPTGGLIFSGSVTDVYSQGPSPTVENIKQIVESQIRSFNLPSDTAGIYIVIGSADVTDIRPDGSTFCTPGTTPHHGAVSIEGSTIKYGYLGAADRCPTSAGPQFIAADGSMLPTPNGNFAADAMASSLAHLFNVIVTNPLGYGGWYDRIGLENAGKCMGKFGETFLSENGARANVMLGGRPFLIQQNWINDRRGRCTISIAQ